MALIRLGWLIDVEKRARDFFFFNRLLLSVVSRKIKRFKVKCWLIRIVARCSVG